jgi:fumarate hydratase class II
MAMYHIIGCDTTIAIATQAGQLELNVMMPVIAHDLFEMVEIMIGSQKAFTEKCINGLQANPLKTDFWLSRNASLVTALNPLIGYDSGAKLAREASDRGLAIQQVAAEKAEMGLLLSITDGKPISRKQVEDAFSDLYWMTEGGLI